MPRSITPNLWFDGNALEAAEYYCEVFPDSRIHRVTHHTEAGPRPAGEVLTVDFELRGQRFTAINGGPEFPFTEAVSFVVECEDQEEIDRHWDRFVGDGGEEGPCGWCKDRYGLSWQIVPALLDELIGDDDPERARRAMEAMFTMRKLDVAALRAAAEGVKA